MIFLLGMFAGVMSFIYLLLGLFLSVVAEHDGGFKWVFFWPIFLIINAARYKKELSEEEAFILNAPDLNMITDEISPETYEDVVKILTEKDDEVVKILIEKEDKYRRNK